MPYLFANGRWATGRIVPNATPIWAGLPLSTESPEQPEVRTDTAGAEPPLRREAPEREQDAGAER